MKIKNVNRKLIAGILAVTLLAGCSSESYGIPTETTDKGEVVYSSVELNDIKNWKIVVFEFAGEKVIYLVEKTTAVARGYSSASYFNVFGGQCLYTTTNKNTILTIENEMQLGDYLIVNNIVQSSYTEEELKEILEQIKTEYELQQVDKQLVIGN